MATIPDGSITTPIKAAAHFATAGLRVFPVDMRPDENGQPRKAPPYAYTWKQRATTVMDEVVDDFTEAEFELGMDFVAVGWAVGQDHKLAVDLDGAEPEWWGELGQTAVNVTKRGKHLIFEQPDGRSISNSTSKFPSEGWGEVRGTGGYVVIWWPGDRPGFDTSGLDRIAPFPRPEWLCDADDEADAVSPSELEEFKATHTDGSVEGIKGFVTKLAQREPGASRHVHAAPVAAWIAREAAAGLVPAGEAFTALENWWAEVGKLVENDTEGRPKTRHLGPRELRAIECWAVGQLTPERVAEVRASAAPRSPQLDPTALYGILGEVVDVIRPHTESCDAALLVLLLVQVGNFIGRGPHVMVESDRHGCALFAVLVGESARSRKGTAAGRAGAVMAHVDATGLWKSNSIASGFGSGEGVITALDNESRNDPRLLVDERELHSLLTVASRDGSLLSSVLRNGWDGQPLRSRVKKSSNSLEATDYHLSVSGHVTKPELERLLTSTEQSNGFGNRFLWVHAHRARRLPHGGALSQSAVTAVGRRLAKAVRAAQKIDRVVMTAAARTRWEELYDAIADAELPGIVAALTNRAEAQVLRLSLLYAVLDGANRIDAAHLEAGWALWRYCEASVLHIWGDTTRDRDVDRLVDALRSIAPAGMTVNEAHETVFGKHKPAGPIAARARRYGLIRTETEMTEGRQREVLYAV